MDFKEAATKLIEAVDGTLSDANIKGVMHVFSTIIEVNNDTWEQWITKDTDEILAIDNAVCSCGTQIRVERSRNLVYVEEI